MSVSTDEIIRCLADLGLNVSNLDNHTISWVLKYPGVCQLLNFLCANVNGTDNVLTPDELLKFNELERQGFVLDGEELENAIDNLECDYPGIVDLDDDDIAILQEKLTDELELLDELQCLKKASRENVEDLENELIKLKNMDLEVTVDLHTASEDCLKLSKELTAVDNELINCLDGIKAVFYQFPAASLYQFREIYQQNAEATQKYLRIYFKQAFATTKAYQKYSSEILTANLNRIMSSLVPALVAHALALVEQECQNIFAINVRKIEKPRLSETQFQNELLNCKKNIDLLQNDILELSQDCLNTTAQNVAEFKICKLVDRYAALKLERRKRTRTKLEVLQNYLMTARNRDYFFWEYLHAETDRITSGSNSVRDDLQELSRMQKLSHSRTEIMKNVIKDNQYQQLNQRIEDMYFLKSVNQLLLASPSQIQPTLTIEAYEKLVIDFQYRLHNVPFANLETFKKKLKPMISSLNVSNNLARTGPSRLSFDETYVIRELYQRDQALNTITHNIDVICDKFRNTQKIINEDEWFKYKHFLWVWFLLQPKKVLKIILQLEAAIANESHEIHLKNCR